jgi:Type I phosphodiesterase / nucleotide pyrophosphatase
MRAARDAQRGLTRAWSAAALLALLSAGLAAQESREAGRPATRAPGSRLVVMIVIDQLSSDVLQSAWPHLGPDGFRRLAREGTFYPRALYDHSCSETGPGHATLATGASPSVHGIVGNEWIDSATANVVGCVDDPLATLVPSGSRGASAHRLLVPTFGALLGAVHGPRVTTAAIAIKDRAAILPAGRSGDYVVWYDRRAPCDYTTSSAFLPSPSPPPWLARLNESRPPEMRTGFVWEKAAPPAAYADLGPDDDPAESSAHGTRTFPHEIRPDQFSLPAGFCEAVCASPAGLDLTFAGARVLLDEARLGQDEVPDFLSISLSANDLVGHLYGPESHEVRDMTIRTDRHLAAFLQELDRVVPEGRYHVLLSADHGVGPIPEALARRGVEAGRVNPDRIKLAIEAGLAEAYGKAPESRHWVRRTLDADVLLDRRLIAEKRIPLAEAQARAASSALTAPGVLDAIAVHRIFDGSLPAGPFRDVIRRGQREPRSVDVYVVPRPYWLFGSNRANHGTVHEYDRRVPLILCGPGIRRGFEDQAPVSPGSGIVTLARALGMPPPSGADHPALEAALER